MKKTLSLLVITVLLLSGCQYFGQKLINSTTSKPAIIDNRNAELPPENIATAQIATAIDNSTISTDNTDSTAPQYSIYLIAIGDKGLGGKEAGCADSVVPVMQDAKTLTPSNTDLLKEAFDNLLNLKDKDYGESGLSNFLADSKLKLLSAEIKDGKAIIKLAGEISQTDSCAFPRAKAQLEETATQFDEAKSAEIYLNNAPLKQNPKVKK